MHQLRWTLILSLLAASHFLQAQETQRLEENLTSWAKQNAIEKIYLHTDKPYYAIGDTMWFKTYVVNTQNQPSTLSGAVYIDLIDQADSLVHALKLPLMNGLAKGNLVLSDGLHAGNYRVRAYTQWMRNAGPDFFYQKAFAVGSPVTWGLTGTARLLSQTEGNNKKKVVRLQFVNKENKQPVGQTKVHYTLKTSKQYYMGEAVTSEDGDILIDVTGKGKEDPVYRIASNLVANGESFQQHFVIHSEPDSAAVTFFPEGGTLVAGLQQRVAVKAIGSDGLGVAVHGEVQDSKGQVVAVWDTQHAGMGLFNLTPQSGESYRAHILLPDSTSLVCSLPQATIGGHALSVYNNTGTDSVLVRLQATPHAYGAVYLLAQQNGQLIFSQTFDQRRPLVQFFVPARIFPSGITQFTLFDGTGQPVAERIVFFQPTDTLHLDVPELSSTKVRDSVHVPISVIGHPVAHFTSLSVSVTDIDRVPANEAENNSIFSQLLLQSDLKGYIERPGYYFHAVDAQKRDHLDLLLMTQGYRRFAWKALAKGEIPKPLFPPEALLQNISGTLLTLRGKPVEGGTITLLSNRLGVMMHETTNAAGRFHFDNLLIQDSLAFTLQGRKPKGSNKVELKLDEISRAPLTPWQVPDPTVAYGGDLKTYLEYKQQVVERNAVQAGTHQLAEVEVTAKRDEYLNIRGLSIPMKQIDYVIHPKASDSCKNLLECIRRWVPGITFGFVNRARDARQTNIRPIEGVGANASNQQPINVGGGPGSSGAGILTGSQYHQQNLNRQGGGGLQVPVLISNGREMQVIYNGFPVAASNDGDTDLNYSYLLKDRKAFDPSNIKAVYIKEFNGTGASTMGLTNLDGRCFLYIETYDGMIYPPNPDWDYTLLKPQGYSIVREFYSPRYDRGPDEARQADQRSTIYWSPDVRPDKTGHASFGYFNAGQAGTYQVVIEGLNSDGQLGRKIMQYQVKE